MRPASRCGAGESSDWSASGRFGWRDYACASPFWGTGRSSSRARADDARGDRGCEKDIAKRVCPRGFLNVGVCEEGGAVRLDSEGEDGGCGRSDGVEGAGYCQCRCGGLRLRWAAFIVGGGDGGEEGEEEEEKGSGESVEAHSVSLMVGTCAKISFFFFFFFFWYPDFCAGQKRFKICGVWSCRRNDGW